MTDDQVIDAAAILTMDTQLMDMLILREENAELRRELDRLMSLIQEWARNQYIPDDHKQGDDLLPWLRRARKLDEQMLRLGGVEPRKVTEE
jgi:hypothetical protein